MRKLIIAALAVAFAAPAFAGSVSGYYKKNGTYVQGYNRSDADGIQENNYSYKGNVNPYNGKVGTNSGHDQFGNDCSFSLAC